MFASNVQDNNHGSAAAVTIAAASAPMAPGNLIPMQPPVMAHTLEVTAPGQVVRNQVAPSVVQPPLAAVMTPGAATGSFGNSSTEYSTDPRYGRKRSTATPADSRASGLGAELDARSRSQNSSDDTLTFSPDAPVPEARR